MLVSQSCLLPLMKNHCMMQQTTLMRWMRIWALLHLTSAHQVEVQPIAADEGSAEDADEEGKQGDADADGAVATKRERNHQFMFCKQLSKPGWAFSLSLIFHHVPFHWVHLRAGWGIQPMRGR